MTLTRGELAKIRSWYDAQLACGIYPHDTGKLLDFAETMLPMRDALVTLFAAEVALRKSRSLTLREFGEASDSDAAARMAFWKLARELPESDVEVEP